jgi:hypothetical protein
LLVDGHWRFLGVAVGDEDFHAVLGEEVGALGVGPSVLGWRGIGGEEVAGGVTGLFEDQGGSAEGGEIGFGSWGAGGGEEAEGGDEEA